MGSSTLPEGTINNGMNHKIKNYLLDYTIDKDHEYILMSLNLLSSSLDVSGSHIGLIDNLARLKDVWDLHVQHESDIMINSKYDSSVMGLHDLSHRLVEHYFDMAISCLNKSNLNSLIDDILKHIDTHDRELVKFISERKT